MFGVYGGSERADLLVAEGALAFGDEESAERHLHDLVAVPRAGGLKVEDEDDGASLVVELEAGFARVFYPARKAFNVAAKTSTRTFFRTLLLVQTACAGFDTCATLPAVAARRGLGRGHQFR